MKTIVRLKTSRLFYNKWPYKIRVNVGKAAWFKQVEKWPQLYESSVYNDLQDVVRRIKPFDSTKYQTRGESDRLSVFCMDREFLDEFVKEFERIIIDIHEPGSDTEQDILLNSPRKPQIRNNLFKGKYQFKVYLKTNTSVADRETINKWANSAPGTVFVAGATKHWFTGSYWCPGQPFIYVDNEKTLSMALLVLGRNTRCISEAVIRSNINT